MKINIHTQKSYEQHPVGTTNMLTHCKQRKKTEKQHKKRPFLHLSSRVRIFHYCQALCYHPVIIELKVQSSTEV